MANGITDSFDPSRRIAADVNTLRWEILPKALGMGKHMEEDTKKDKSERSINRPRKETQATQAGGPDEGERSVTDMRSREHIHTFIHIHTYIHTYIHIYCTEQE